MSKRKKYLFMFIGFSIPPLITVLCLFLTGSSPLELAIKSTEHVVFVQNTNLESMPGIEILDANNPSFRILRNEPNRVDVWWNRGGIFIEEPKCRVKKLISDTVHIMAKLNDIQYPIVIDTGFSGELMVNDVVVLENKLKIFPIKTNDLTNTGFCNIDKIEIGEMKITTPPCKYSKCHYETRKLWRTQEKEKTILFGLELMRNFKYISIDNINSEVEFSMESFGDKFIRNWVAYNMSIENDDTNEKRLMIEIPIAGEKTKIMFDTGYKSSLAMAENKWKDFSEKFNIVSKKNSRAQLPHGWENIKLISVRNFEIGHRNISNATINILKNQSRGGKDFFMLGMECFKDTIIVLDFEHNTFWIKKQSDLSENDDNT